MCVSETGASERNYFDFAIPLVSVGIVATGIFITLAAFQVLPQGVNAISQLGALGQGLGYALMGGGVVVGVILLSVRYYLQGQQESTALKPLKRGDVKEKITFDTLFDHIVKNNFEELKKIHELHPTLFNMDRDGFNLLHLAVREGKVEIVKWLYEAHPNLQDGRNNEGMTPFNKVVDCWKKAEKEEIIKYFLAQGCAVVEPPKRWGLFFSTIMQKNIPLITILLDARPILFDAKDFTNRTPIQVIAYMRQLASEGEKPVLDLDEIVLLIENAKTRYENSEKKKKL